MASTCNHFCERVRAAVSPLDPMQRVDIVYTYVNNSAPSFVTRLDELIRTHNVSNQERNSTRQERWHSRNDLLYSVRSLYARYARIERLFFVIAAHDQIPRWLNTTHPDVHIVLHADIFPPNASTPSLTSDAIEPNLFRIRGLRTPFLFLNDDFFVHARVLDNRVFFDQETHLVRLNQVRMSRLTNYPTIVRRFPGVVVRREKATYPELFRSRVRSAHQRRSFVANVAKSHWLIRRVCPKTRVPFGFLNHHPYLLHSGVYDVLWRTFSDEFAYVVGRPFRQYGTLNSLHLHAFALLACNASRPIRAAMHQYRTTTFRESALSTATFFNVQASGMHRPTEPALYAKFERYMLRAYPKSPVECSH